MLRKCIEWAIAESQKPEDESEWNQSVYHHTENCHTAYCVAGYAVYISGDQLHGIGDRARHLLGLTHVEAIKLFTETNTIEDVCRIANQIAARAGETL